MKFLGHIIDKDGIHATPEKVNAVVNAPQPKDVSELRAFLGLLNYYGKFLPNLAGKLHSLNSLLKKQARWVWSGACEKAFVGAKQAMVSAEVLVHYNPELPILVAADASSYGIGAVLSHILPDGSEHPISFASRTLSASEKNYSQIEKEALGLIFAVKTKKGIPPLAASRMQRWSFLLLAYTYDIQFKPTTLHCNADGMSRLPLQQTSTEETPEVTLFNIGQIAMLPVTAQQLQKATMADPTLCKVFRYIKLGWPSQLPEDIPKLYGTHRNELTVEGECIMFGIRVVVPPKLQKMVLQELHSTHPSIQRMKSIGRSHVWWPGIDHDIENMVKACTACQHVKQAPAVAPLYIHGFGHHAHGNVSMWISLGHS